MTEQIGSHGLFCISDTDYAAYALAMQCNALAADAALAADRDALTEGQSRPWVSVTNTNTITVNSAGGTVGPNGLVGELIHPVSATNLFIQSSGMPPLFVFNDPSTYMPPGVFMIGATVKWSMAVSTANTIRQLLVYGIRQIDGSLASETNYTDLYHNEDYQGDGGLTGALMTGGLLDTRAGDVAYLESFFTHGNNPANDLTIAPGAWRMWAIYMGSGLTI